MPGKTHKENEDIATVMDEFPRTPENDSSQSTNLSEREERRSQNRKEGVISRIEDITYKVLRKHEPQP